LGFGERFEREAGGRKDEGRKEAQILPAGVGERRRDGGEKEVEQPVVLCKKEEFGFVCVVIV
jgi:hypothetical protein